MQAEAEEVVREQAEEARDFERARAETLKAIEREEGDTHAGLMRESRNAAIEAEVNTRRLRAERDKLATAQAQDERDFQIKFDELSRVKRQLQQQREEMKQDVLLQERDIKARFEQCKQSEK